MSEKYVITTAQRGGLINWNLLRGLQTYIGDDDHLLILPSNGRFPSSTKADPIQPHRDRTQRPGLTRNLLACARQRRLSSPFHKYDDV